MSDEQKTTEEPEQAYPGHGPHTDGPGPVEDHSDPVTDEVEEKFPVTPGTESSDERREIAEEQRTKIAAAHGDEEAQEKVDDEADDPDPELPADDSPIHGEPTIQPGSTDPTL